MRTVILISGKPGVGKTTLVKRVWQLFPHLFVGFWTEEIRENGTRVGFRVITTEGDSILLAHTTYDSPFRVGRYGVNVEGFEKLVAPLLAACFSGCSKIMLMDEIGRMELFSETFSRSVERLFFQGYASILATVPYKNVHPLVRRLKESFTVYILTPRNREEVFHRVVSSFTGQKFDGQTQSPKDVL
ncbi:MAG: AAA family ATPase [Thermotogae bacterium]|nr:AAA family ATPase [Thermotogota bacterium]